MSLKVSQIVLNISKVIIDATAKQWKDISVFMQEMSSLNVVGRALIANQFTLRTVRLDTIMRFFVY